MKKILGFKVIINLTLFVMLVGGFVFTLGFGICLHIARNEVSNTANKKIESDLECLHGFIDGQLQRVEDVGYSFLCSQFGECNRTNNDKSRIIIDTLTIQSFSEEDFFQALEKFINANPHICGVAIGFEPSFHLRQGTFGFATYVTNVSGENERLRLGEIHDFHQKEWYCNAASSGAPYWSRPFRETSRNKVVACFSLPLYNPKQQVIGVMALDIDTEAFRNKCKKTIPFPDAEVTIVDREYRFISHSDTTYLLRSIEETEEFKSGNNDMMINLMQRYGSGHYTINGKSSKDNILFYFRSIERTGWTAGIECPEESIFGGINRMKRNTSLIAIGSILLMIICFIYLFRRLQTVTLSKANMESELRIAADIQMGMIPKTYPAFPDRNDLDIYGMLKPAKMVGGDLYDYIIQDNKLFFCIGDVSGKGVPASLFMSVMRALFRNSVHLNDSAQIMSSLNTALSEGNDQNMFCTMFLGILDMKTGELEYCNAGHNAPIIIRGNKEAQFLKPKSNLAVGVFEDFPYQKEQTTLNVGDAIYLYTDGVTEAENTKKELLGDEATLKAVSYACTAESTAKKEVENIYTTLTHHTKGAEQNDDITMLMVIFKG